MNEGSFPDFHVGNIIISFLKENHLTQAYLARELGMATPNVNRLLKRDSMDTDLLFGICLKLEHNFFADLCGDDDTDTQFNLKITHIGIQIEKRLKELKMTQSEFASILKVTPSEVSRILKKESFDAQKLLKISRILNYNFFQDFYKTTDYFEDENKSSIASLLKRYEELVIINDRLQTTINEMSEEIKDLKKKLDEAKSK